MTEPDYAAPILPHADEEAGASEDLARPGRSSSFSAAASLFFRQFLASPKSVGSIIPTARATINALLDPIDWSQCRTFVEYGPGTGVFTRSILERARPDLTLIAIDPNPAFIEHLQTYLPDRRLFPILGSAEDVAAILHRHGKTDADFILSGLPFSTLPKGVDHGIVAATHHALKPGGAFLVYQYSLFVLPILQAHFPRVDVERSWQCIPPARLMRAWKS